MPGIREERTMRTEAEIDAALESLQRAMTSSRYSNSQYNLVRRWRDAIAWAKGEEGIVAQFLDARKVHEAEGQ